MKFAVHDSKPFQPKVPFAPIAVPDEIKKKSPGDKSLLVVNLLPEHPYSFNQPCIELCAQEIRNNPDRIKTLKDSMSVSDLIFLLPRMGKSISPSLSVPGAVKTLEATPEYPVTENWIRKKLKTRATFMTFSWFEFFLLLRESSGNTIPGIPVSIAFPEAGDFYFGWMPKDSSLGRIMDAVPGEIDLKELTCFDHPFCGELRTPDFTLQEIKPYSFIFLKQNREKKVPLGLRISLLASERGNLRFQELYSSLPSRLNTPCQKCLRCGKICPVQIVPFMISALSERDLIREASRFQPEKCVECGLCSYVCPSGIPLLHSIKTLKKKLGIA